MAQGVLFRTTGACYNPRPAEALLQPAGPWYGPWGPAAAHRDPSADHGSPTAAYRTLSGPTEVLMRTARPLLQPAGAILQPAGPDMARGDLAVAHGSLLRTMGVLLPPARPCRGLRGSWYGQRGPIADHRGLVAARGPYYSPSQRHTAARRSPGAASVGRGTAVGPWYGSWGP